MPKKILFINQEIAPYIPESPLSLLGQHLPEKIQEKGYEIRTFMPKWGTINERRGQLHEVIRLSGLNISIGGNDHPLLIKVASIPVSRLQVYFIDNEDYFTKRKMESDDKGEEYADNGERAIFFARGVLETVKKLRWAPDIIVCQGWMSAIVPLYIKTVYADEPCFADTKVIAALYASNLKKTLGNNFKQCVEYMDVKAENLNAYKDNFDVMELGKLAVDYSDAVCIASETVNKDLYAYAKEKGMPFMEYPGDNFSEAFENFFNELTKE